MAEKQVKADLDEKIRSFYTGEIPAIGLKHICDPSTINQEWEAPYYPIAQSADLTRAYQMVYDALVRQFKPKKVDSSRTMFIYRAGRAANSRLSFHADNHGQLLGRGNMFRFHATTLGSSTDLFRSMGSNSTPGIEYAFEEKAGDASLFVSLGSLKSLLPTEHSYSSIEIPRRYMIGEIHFNS